MPAKTSLLLLLISVSSQLFGQWEGIVYTNHDYKPNIRSVEFHLDGLLLSTPVIELGGYGALVLTFDDLDADVKNYAYRIIHCDADWTPSDLSYFEYLSGFEEGDIRDYNYSFKTISDYTHYWLVLPNRQVQWTKSGNYLLVVYENEQEKVPVLTRRFVVVEPIVTVAPRFTFPTIVAKNRTHQELDFVVNHRGFKIVNPRISISATLLQNGRWDNAVTGIPPFFVRSDEVLEFDYQDKLVFPAGREWRQLDLRSIRNPAPDVAKIDRFDDGYYMTLLKDKKRQRDPYLSIRDINGNFVIENWDEDDPAIESEYLNVLFSLTSEPFPDHDVYLFGGMSNWELKDEFQMAYNPQFNAYIGTLRLKQGFYNYGYAVASKDKKTVDFGETEGNWFETENDYTILIYFRPFGERYDRVIGAFTFNSRR